ncbi:MAG: DUF268 domain-containing protein [Lachnospiraceae bacterium]|nr:DUF268 domain-containing protein [Lachnospiraceae bacterium]
MIIFYIWGTGVIANEVWKHGVNGEFRGFVETRKRTEQYNGHPVYDIDEIMGGVFDYIIVANRFSDDIYAICRKKKISLDKVIFMIKGKHTAFNSSPNVRRMLGEENYTVYAGEYGETKGTFFEDDCGRYTELNAREAFRIQEKYLHPVISEKYGFNSGFDDYFWMDLWAAKYIISNSVIEHYDIGSRVDGFVAHLLAAGIKVNIIDIRPVRGTIENLTTIMDDATLLQQFEDDSIQSLSALCSPEHFGLGRYGDPIDPEACFKFFAKAQEKLKTGGKLYIAVPIGQDRVEFNAHRVFYADTIISSFDKLRLVEYSAVVNGEIVYNVDVHKFDDMVNSFVTGLFFFEKP